jgi:hypothetical protein
MNDDNWEIWNAPPCRSVSAIWLIVPAILYAMLRVWPISIPFLAVVAFFAWQFIKAG